MDYLEILKNCQAPTLIAIAIAFLLLDRRSEKRIEKLEDKIEKRFDKLTEEVKDIDRRLCRIEGSLSSKDCCMLKDDRQSRKVE